MPPKLRLGVWTRCLVLVKYMHPAKVIDDKIRSRVSQTHIQNLNVIKQDRKIVNKNEQAVIVFWHDDFGGTVQRWAKVETEGPEEHIFDREDNAPTDVPAPVANRGTVVESKMNIPCSIFHARNCPEDVSAVRNQGLTVDCDDEPAPENVPLPASNKPDDVQWWGA